jgi:hypothetical protein
MIRLTQAIVAVMSCTLVAGTAGGIVGAAVGRLAPTFVRWLYSPAAGAAAQVDPTEFGFGLGVVSGLFLGTGTGVFLVCVLALRDAWLARAGIVKYHEPAREAALD